MQHKRGSLVKVAFVLTELSDRYLLHELQASAHAWRHFLPEVIVLNIRWYCRYALSYRNHRRDDAGEGAKRRSYDGISVGAGLSCLFVVYQDATGQARDRAMAYAKGIGGTRGGILEASFREETEY